MALILHLFKKKKKKVENQGLLMEIGVTNLETAKSPVPRAHTYQKL